MCAAAPNPHEALEKLFHEPNRLAILSALCAAPGGLTFGDLKTTCRLTDGNLSRHLAALEEAGVIRVKKEFVGVKPRTTVFLTDAGLDRFNDYLAALEDVLEQARRAQTALAAKSVPAAPRGLRTSRT